jgi:integrase
MGLMLKTTSKWWYARPVVKGKRLFVNLGVEVKGRRPATLRELGDADFEASRQAAMAAFQQRYGGRVVHSEQAEYHRKMYLMLTGVDLAKRDVVLLRDLESAWVGRLSSRPRTKIYMHRAKLAIKEFVAFAEGRKVAAMAGVTRDVAGAWVRQLEESGLAPGTVESKVVVLRSVFSLLAEVGGCPVNPFHKVEVARGDTVHRRPLAADEMAAVVAAADDVVRGPIITGMCTAMRRADCCMLKWDDVDLVAGFVRVRTAKTGAVAEIPVLPALARELRKTAADKRSGFVWQDAAKMMASNPCGISYRVKKAFVAAKVVRSVKRVKGRRLASVADFHSLRTTWITMALSAGVPIELVRRVTGHAGVDVVLKHYFQPGRKEFKAIVEGKMGKSFKQKKTKKAKKGSVLGIDGADG